MACDVAGNFAATGGVTDMDGIAKIEMLGDCGGVSSIMVHVVPVRHLTRAAMATAVDTDHAIAMLDEEQHLGVPVVGAERPAMMEDNRLALAPVLVEDLSAVLRFNEAHFGLHELKFVRESRLSVQATLLTR